MVPYSLERKRKRKRERERVGEIKNKRRNRDQASVFFLSRSSFNFSFSPSLLRGNDDPYDAIRSIRGFSRDSRSPVYVIQSWETSFFERWLDLDLGHANRMELSAGNIRDWVRSTTSTWFLRYNILSNCNTCLYLFHLFLFSFVILLISIDPVNTSLVLSYLSTFIFVRTSPNF